jgi:Helix-turn-helix domain
LSPLALDETLLSREEASKLLQLSPGTLSVWSSVGRNKYDLPFVKIGRLVRYKLSDLNLFVEKRTTKKRN